MLYLQLLMMDIQQMNTFYAPMIFPYFFHEIAKKVPAPLWDYKMYIIILCFHWNPRNVNFQFS